MILTDMGVIRFCESYSVTFRLDTQQESIDGTIDTKLVWFDVDCEFIERSCLRGLSAMPPSEYMIAFEAWKSHYHQSMSLYTYFQKMFRLDPPWFM